MNEINHILTVWNPSYAIDTMDAHLGILLDGARRAAKEPDEKREKLREDLHVWWGKIRSPRRREEKLEHLDSILAVQKQIEQGVETHIYLTDYQSLYVGWLDRITSEDISGDAKLFPYIPSYYRKNKYDFDIWFRLRDIRRIVVNDTIRAIEELKTLKNVAYDNQPISIYGGIVTTPILVTRDKEQRWFDSREALIGSRLWAEYDASMRGETAKIASDLRANLFGSEVWGRFEIATRNFLATGEMIFRTHREDPRFDYSTALLEYGKALEMELNALIWGRFTQCLGELEDKFTVTKIQNYTYEIDFKTYHEHRTLNSLLAIIKKNKEFEVCAAHAFDNRDKGWLLREIPAQIKQLVDLRNPGVHKEEFTCDEVDKLRNRLLGIGCEGLIVEVARRKGGSCP